MFCKCGRVSTRQPRMDLQGGPGSGWHVRPGRGVSAICAGLIHYVTSRVLDLQMGQFQTVTYQSR